MKPYFKILSILICILFVSCDCKVCEDSLAQTKTELETCQNANQSRLQTTLSDFDSSYSPLQRDSNGSLFTTKEIKIPYYGDGRSEVAPAIVTTLFLKQSNPAIILEILQHKNVNTVGTTGNYHIYNKNINLTEVLNMSPKEPLTHNVYVVSIHDEAYQRDAASIKKIVKDVLTKSNLPADFIKAQDKIETEILLLEPEPQIVKPKTVGGGVIPPGG